MLRGMSTMSELAGLALGSHVCWPVDDPDTYVETAAQLLRDGRDANEKPVALGPDGSALQALSGEGPFTTINSSVGFLATRPLATESIFAALRQRSRIATDEGYRGLRLVADMDWLLPMRPTLEGVVAYELLLDRVVKELGATVVCAYRCSSFDCNTLTGVRCVHGTSLDDEVVPPFRLHAGAGAGWELSGEVDCSVAGAFSAAFMAAAAGSARVADVSRVTFIDVTGMRTIVTAAKVCGGLRLVGASSLFRRSWELGGFAQDTTLVEFAA